MKKHKKLTDKRKLREFFAATLDERRDAQPACRHFGGCGGCEFQDVPYPDQLLAKRAAFEFVLAQVTGEFRDLADREEDPDRKRELLVLADRLLAAFLGSTPGIVASPLPLGYRQRMDYVNAFGLTGLRRANRHRQVVELEECPLLGADGFAVVLKAKRLARAAGLESYDYLRHTGQLRYFVIRQSRSGERLLSLVTKTEEAREQVLSVLNELARDGDIASGHWLMAPGLGDVSFGQELAHVGNPVIHENMNGVTLAIGPNTFFQANPAVAEKAYAAMAAFARPLDRALDLYSGVGSIAIALSKTAAQVTAVENVPENVLLAQENIRENGTANVRLTTADSAAFLKNLAAGTSTPDSGAADRAVDFLAVNPPRPGVGPDGMAAIRALAPERLAYLSCNPFTLLRDLARVLDKYEARSLTVYDMFPQTRHFETLILLERKKETMASNDGDPQSLDGCSFKGGCC